jgi:hypothetical protein
MSAPTIQAAQEEYLTVSCAITTTERMAADLNRLLHVLQDRRSALLEQIEEDGDADCP